jgi:hypothetical protein
MNTASLMWETVTGLKGQKAQAGNVSYFVDNVVRPGLDGFAAALVVRGWGGGARGLNLGKFNTLEQAKQACERHYADGCDVTAAKPFVIRGIDQPRR